MSVSWSVLPIVPDITEWLGKHNLLIPKTDSRWATLDELLTVLRTYDQPIHVEDHYHDNSHTVTIIMGKISFEPFAQISGILKETHIEFWFERSGNQGRTMLNILQKLSVTCGAQIIFNATGNNPKPIIITPQTNIEQALQNWWYR